MFWLGISEAILSLRQQGRDHLALTEEVNRLRKAVTDLRDAANAEKETA